MNHPTFSDGDDDYSPVIGFATEDDDNLLSVGSSMLNPWTGSTKEVSFSGLRQNFCVCFIDMISSTKIAAELNDLQLGKYYSIFLNAMATIARNFGAKVIKTAGDSLIYYFPNTADPINRTAFEDVLECGDTMIAAHHTINAKLQEERLPPPQL